MMSGGSSRTMVSAVRLTAGDSPTRATDDKKPDDAKKPDEPAPNLSELMAQLTQLVGLAANLVDQFIRHGAAQDEKAVPPVVQGKIRG